MCVQRYWTLKCGHACFVNSFCKNSPKDEETQTPYLCSNAESYPGTPGNPLGACRLAMCPHGVSSWRCCSCNNWNNEVDFCLHFVRPELLDRTSDAADREATDGEVANGVTARNCRVILTGEPVLELCNHEHCDRCLEGASTFTSPRSPPLEPSTLLPVGWAG